MLRWQECLISSRTLKEVWNLWRLLVLSRFTYLCYRHFFPSEQKQCKISALANEGIKARPRVWLTLSPVKNWLISTIRLAVA